MNELRALPKQLWLGLFVLLLVSGLIASAFRGEDTLAETQTSYGAAPAGWGAAYDLLEELGFQPARTRLRLPDRPLSQTQWLVDPRWRRGDLQEEIDNITRFARAGGTVVLLGADADIWDALSLAIVSSERAYECERPRRRGPNQRARKGSDLAATDEELVTLEGPWLRGRRRIELCAARLFDPSANAESEPVVRSERGDFVIERRVGAGKLVALADAGFLRNERLANRQHAPFLVDLARAYGAPAFDERCHGLTPQRSLWTALGVGSLALVVLAFAAATLAALAHARRWPPRARADDDATLTLEVFVGSLASLYRARGRALPAAVFRAYRHGFLPRLARALGEDGDLHQNRLEQRLERDARRLGPAGRWLAEDAAPDSRAELVSAICALEQYAATLRPGKRQG